MSSCDDYAEEDGLHVDLYPLDLSPYLRMHEYPTEDEEGVWEFCVMDSGALGRTRHYTGRFMDGVRWVRAWAYKEEHFLLALLDKEET